MDLAREEVVQECHAKMRGVGKTSSPSIRYSRATRLVLKCRTRLDS